MDIKAGSLFFYPFHLSVAGVDFDYVLAQPIAKVAQGEQTICYFMEIPGIAPSLSASGEVTQLPVDTVGFEKGNVQVIVLSKAKAMRFHLIGNHVVFAKGSVYTDGHAVRCEAAEGYFSVDGETKEIVKKDLSSLIALEETSKVSLPYGYYLYSYGKRRYYRLKIDRKLLENRFDVKLTFSFIGKAGKVFSTEYADRGAGLMRTRNNGQAAVSGRGGTAEGAAACLGGVSWAVGEYPADCHKICGALSRRIFQRRLRPVALCALCAQGFLFFPACVRVSERRACGRTPGAPSLEEYNAQVRNGIRLNDRFYLRVFPVAYQFRGFHATLMGRALAAMELARALNDREIKQVAVRQMEWILGCNPFAVSSMYGEGHDYHPLYAPMSPQLVGAVPVWFETFENEDQPFYPMQNNATYKEVWVHTTCRMMWLIAML